MSQQQSHSQPWSRSCWYSSRHRARYVRPSTSTYSGGTASHTTNSKMPATSPPSSDHMALGKLLGCSQAKINYLEIGKTQQQPEEVAKLLRFYDADVAHVDRLPSLAGRADRGTWWAPFSDMCRTG